MQPGLLCGQRFGPARYAVHLDDLGASIGDYPRHLHAVPARTLAHDIAIEAVQNALVSQLQGVIQHHHVSCLLYLDHVPRCLHVCIWRVKSWVRICVMSVCDW